MASAAGKPMTRLPFLIVLVMAMSATRAHAQVSSGALDLPSRAAQLQPKAGDRVVVHVYGDATLSDAATLDERGRIMLPRIGMIQADAFTVAQLRDTVRARLATILKDPAVEVTVLRRIIVGGEVMKPGVYFADLTASIGEMIAQSGGLKETASARKVYLLRGAEKTRINNWESDQSPASDLHSGDQILVGRQSWLALNIIPFASVTLAVTSLAISVLR
jgi:protein involved in polysaccharide export with SLBB domain